MTLPHEQIFTFLKRFPNTRTIIVNGGDPLMVPPEYYYRILDHLKEIDSDIIISLTTNLWDFYKNPDKWAALFKHPQIQVGTSFQYGEKRRVNKNTVYTEELFRQVMHLFKERIGYYPGFISVVDEENLQYCMKTVELAKEYDVVCKLNNAAASGRQGRPLPVSKIYGEYIKIFKAGLGKWEYNVNQIFIERKNMTCPVSRTCDTGIRALNPDGAYFSCGSFADDKLYPIDFKAEMNDKTKVAAPLSSSIELLSLKEECLTCPLFTLCNGCRKHINDLKRSGMVEEHCSLMKSQEKEILEAAYGT